MSGPGRPANTNGLLLAPNGSPQYLGTIVSTGAALNNATTATPFSQTPLGPATPTTRANLTGTLAGKTLLIQATVAGVILPATNALVGANQTTPALLALQSVQPPLQGTSPGPALALNERVIVTMRPDEGWLQWMPLAGAGNLLVWELV